MSANGRSDATRATAALGSLRTKPLKEQVVGELTRLIEDGVLVPGERLPAERVLAQRLGVSRGTVREAVQFLEALGVLAVRHGSGTYVTDAGGGGAGLGEQWREWTRIHSARVRDLLEVRRGLESLAAELAAGRATDAARDRLREALDQMEAVVERDDVPTLVQADVEFHRALVEASGNAVLVDFAATLGDELTQERAATWGTHGRPTRSLVEHRTIFEAIERGDAAAARTAVLDHIASIERDVAHLIASSPPGDPARRSPSRSQT